MDEDEGEAHGFGLPTAADDACSTAMPLGKNGYRTHFCLAKSKYTTTSNVSSCSIPRFSKMRCQCLQQSAPDSDSGTEDDDHEEKSIVTNTLMESILSMVM